MTPEHRTQNEILAKLGSRHDIRLFRNNTATGWQGRFISRSLGRLILDNPVPIHAGLFKGSGDLIGWKTVEINGRQYAVFLSIEVKSARGIVTREQQLWREKVNTSGGIAIVARSVEEAEKLIAEMSV